MNDALMRYLGITVCYSAGDGGSGGSGGDAGGDVGGSSADDAPASTALGAEKVDDGADSSDTPADDASDDTKNKAGDDDAADKDSDADKKADDDSEDSEKDDNTDQDSEPLALTAPEGMEHFQEEFDSFAKDMSPWLKENPDATPQQMLAEAARRQATLVAAEIETNQKAFNDQIEKWSKQNKADPVIGGDKYEENLAVAISAIDKFCSPEFKEHLNATGLGENTDMIKLAFAAGQSLKESPTLKPTQTGTEKSFANKVYPD